MWDEKLERRPLGRPARAQRHASNSTRRSRGTVPRLLAILLISVAASGASAVDSSREQVIKIVAQIQRADYEGNRAALKRLYGDLTPFAQSKELASRVRYWRGFALWRRAINGFNDSVDAKELEEDLKQALDEFNEAAKNDPGFVDAKIGALSCVSILAFSINQNNPARQQELITRGREMRKDAQAADPGNPRLLWVLGPNLWYSPPERGGGQAKAMELYEKGLEAIRKHKTGTSDPLEPSWGEPELLMNLAWSNLNRTTPELNAAEQYAHSALELVPYWHYVRDILMPQIQEAKRKLH
jgi:tetratricopeptide (TPR) repeat protein